MSTSLPKNIGSFIWYFLKQYKAFSASFVSCAVLAGFWGPINSWLIKKIIDTLESNNIENVESNIFWLAVAFIINFDLHNLLWRAMAYLNYKFQPLIKNQIIKETFGYIQKASYKFFQDNLSGRIASQINILADNIERVVHDLSRFIIRGVVLLIITFYSMHQVHPRFFYALMIWSVLFCLVSFIMSRKIVGLSENHAESETAVAGELVDSITNSINMRIFARSDYEMSYIERFLNVTRKTFRAKELYLIKMHLVQGWSISIMLGFMLYLLIDLRKIKAVTIGDFALILGLVVEVAFVTWWTMEQIDELNKSIGKCKQSIKALIVPIGVKDKQNAQELVITNGQIVFDNVKFSYNISEEDESLEDKEQLFQNKSVVIDGGQKVGLVGYSGGGKSTFVNLILRFYDVRDGRILVDNQDIKEVTQDSLRNNIAMIPQDPSLFHRSIMENIRYGKIEATNEEVIEAAKQAEAHDFIVRLPQGYETLVGERGIKLSGGQRQRIAIARAILKNAPILILDEATSQLDSLTEESIQSSMRELMENKTTIVVAHRLSTLLHMDRILVFDKGRIVEDGSHKELLKKKGLYKTLWEAQVGGFIPQK